MDNDPNLANLKKIAHSLGQLKDEVVFVGGAIVGLLVTDPAAPQIRVTKDIDCIIEVVSRADYDTRVRQLLIQQGFRELIGEDIPICAWEISGIRLDIMPTTEKILGFSNRWYTGAISNAKSLDLDGMTIQVISPPYFLATKLEAFYGRGREDYVGSADLEDVMAVIDGRETIVDEISTADFDVREYLALSFDAFLGEGKLEDALPGHIVDPGREHIILDRMKRIARFKNDSK